MLATLLGGENTGDNVARERWAAGAALRPEGFAVMLHRVFPPQIRRQSGERLYLCTAFPPRIGGEVTKRCGVTRWVSQLSNFSEIS